MKPPTTDLLRLHRAWIGLLQPDGIVVSAAALADADLVPPPVTAATRERLAHLLAAHPTPHARLAALATELLDHDPGWLRDAPALLARFARALPEFDQTLRPDAVLVDPADEDAPDEAAKPVALVAFAPVGHDLDAPLPPERSRWRASPTALAERLLRETGVALGLVFNGDTLRIVYAPAGEGTGTLTFPLDLCATPDGAPALAALMLVLGRDRLFDVSSPETGPDRRHLARLLNESRRYQNNVSTALAEQVLDGLWALLRGFEMAHRATRERLLRDWVTGARGELYGGLLTVLLRLIFLLYAEDRDQLPGEAEYTRAYGVRDLFERLRDDAGRHPDTMELRFGAWARLLATFRLIHDGGGFGRVRLPSRAGGLFDPNLYPFLEGRPHRALRQTGEVIDAPEVPDATVLSVLSGLLRVDREDLSYKTLGVEELGSVYESMMGFTVEVTDGRALALKPDDVVVSLDALLAVKPVDREKWLKERAGADLPAKMKEAVTKATSVEALADALRGKTSRRTPEVLPTGSLVLQPTAERRRSGSHYTPRSLTEPIVKRTLDPVLDALGPQPSHAQLLALKVCDPAMGSGAFLVAACRYLGDRLYDAWQRKGDGGEDGRPEVLRAVSPGDDERVVARRLVAQHCLYGVDKNPFAVDLARLSLWLETLAREHPFTFLDHCLREGDSLVGVTVAQMRQGSLAEPAKGKGGAELGLVDKAIRDGLAKAQADRAAIRALALSDDTGEKRRLLDEANAAVGFARRLGDALVATFFAESSAGGRKKAAARFRGDVLAAVSPDLLETVVKAAGQGVGFKPFHWEVEFPEVFGRENPGFDAIVGNPPFLGGKRISTNFGDAYLDCLVSCYENSFGSADLSAYFFRRSFDLLSHRGTFGLVATNTIAQGDTRGTGLRWICMHGGAIYDATPRYKWPGLAAVIVSVVHVAKGRVDLPCQLDGRRTDAISAFLRAGTEHDDPIQLSNNAGRSFIGSYILGMGFTFDDGVEAATSLSTMHTLIKHDHRNKERIFPYLGGEELNSSATQHPHRYVINFGQLSETEARSWPDLMSIVEAKVKPERERNSRDSYRKYWWQYAEKRVELWKALDGLGRCLAIARVTSHCGFVWQPMNLVFSDQVVVFTVDKDAFFTVMQSRVHEVWARFFASSLEDRLRYTPSDCFETFPFPDGWETNPELEALGARYHADRAAWMVANNLGLTKFYNAFHDPECDDAGVLALRDLHADMDRAVLRAYGWSDLADGLTTAFVLDHDDGAAEGDAPARPTAKKRPWRLRWPEATRDEVLGRLLALNAARAAAGR